MKSVHDVLVNVVIFSPLLTWGREFMAETTALIHTSFCTNLSVLQGREENGSSDSSWAVVTEISCSPLGRWLLLSMMHWYSPLLQGLVNKTCYVPTLCYASLKPVNSCTLLYYWMIFLFFWMVVLNVGLLFLHHFSLGIRPQMRQLMKSALEVRGLLHSGKHLPDPF